MQPPQPAKNWQGVREADKQGWNCFQPDIRNVRDDGAPTYIGHEDCLYLNVYTPEV